MSKREFFMRNGSYQFCEVIEDQDQNTPFHLRRMKCRTDDGREFIAKPMYGTWGEVRSHDPA